MSRVSCLDYVVGKQFVTREHNNTLFEKMNKLWRAHDTDPYTHPLERSGISGISNFRSLCTTPGHFFATNPSPCWGSTWARIVSSTAYRVL